MEINEELDIRKVIHQKLKLCGFNELTDSELLGIVLAKGAVTEDAFVQSKKYLRECGTWDSFCMADMNVIRNEFALSDQQYRLLGAAAELSRRRHSKEDDKVEFIKDTRDVVRLFKPALAGLNHEEFWLICLNVTGRVIDRIKIGQGGVDGVMVDIKILMRSVLDKLANSIIIVHNHPSGIAIPSPEDIALTLKIRAAAELFDIKLYEHVIITANDFVSVDDYING